MVVQSIEGAAAALPCAAVSCPRPSDPQAALRFSELMASEAAQPPVEATALASGSPAPAQEIPSLGDFVLDGLSKAQRSVNAAWSSVAQTLNQPELKITDLLRTQIGLLQVSIECELVGKGASKSTQNLDTLTKLQ